MGLSHVYLFCTCLALIEGLFYVGNYCMAVIDSISTPVFICVNKQLEKDLVVQFSCRQMYYATKF